MSLLQMSFSGAVLIIVIVAVRAVTINKLPKRTFLILWGAALLRLLVPFSISSIFSVYSLINRNTDISVFEGTQISYMIPIIPTERREQTQEMFSQYLPSVSIWTTIWFIGMILCVAYFVGSYLYWHIQFRTSLLVDNSYTKQWLKKHKLKRPLSIKQSDKIDAPLTYGIFHPVIVMPKGTDWENETQIEYILLHEYVHICRFDTVIKTISALALCVHWFNPVVWVMYILFNRDIELSCDESVVYRLGLSQRSAYAKILISMEARKSGLLPFCNSFSKNSIEQRITAIMKTKKLTIGIFVISAAIIVSIVVLFATSAEMKNEQMISLAVTSVDIYVSTQEDVSKEVAREAELSEYDSPYIGVIESTVGSDQIPSVNLQSNFGYIGSEVIFNRSGVAVNMDGKWIQFDPINDTEPSLKEGAMEKLVDSISYSNSKVLFTIPTGDYSWNIWIGGRVEVEDFGGMSVHYLADESENSNWESGKLYSFAVTDGIYTELYMDIQLNGEEVSINLMDFLPGELRNEKG